MSILVCTSKSENKKRDCDWTAQSNVGGKKKQTKSQFSFSCRAQFYHIGELVEHRIQWECPYHTLEIPEETILTCSKNLFWAHISTVGSLILRNCFLQIALKLLNALIWQFWSYVQWWNPYEAMTSRCEDICHKPFCKNSELTVVSAMGSPRRVINETQL